MYRVPQCMSPPLVGIGTLPPPLSPASVPRTKGGGGTFAFGRGGGGVQIPTTGEKALHSAYSVGDTDKSETNS